MFKLLFSIEYLSFAIIVRLANCLITQNIPLSAKPCRKNCQKCLGSRRAEKGKMFRQSQTYCRDINEKHIVGSFSGNNVMRHASYDITMNKFLIFMRLSQLLLDDVVDINEKLPYFRIEGRVWNKAHRNEFSLIGSVWTILFHSHFNNNLMGDLFVA